MDSKSDVARLKGRGEEVANEHEDGRHHWQPVVSAQDLAQLRHGLHRGGNGIRSVKNAMREEVPLQVGWRDTSSQRWQLRGFFSYFFSLSLFFFLA